MNAAVVTLGNKSYTHAADCDGGPDPDRCEEVLGWRSTLAAFWSSTTSAQSGFLCRVNLMSAGMETLEAEDGEEALGIAAAELPDLILLDVMMPGLDGWAVARELARRPETRQIPIVFLTARGDQEDRLLGQQLGGVAYFVKPFDPIALPARLEGLLRRLERGERDELNPEIASKEARSRSGSRRPDHAHPALAGATASRSAPASRFPRARGWPCSRTSSP